MFLICVLHRVTFDPITLKWRDVTILERQFSLLKVSPDLRFLQTSPLKLILDYHMKIHATLI